MEDLLILKVSSRVALHLRRARLLLTARERNPFRRSEAAHHLAKKMPNLARNGVLQGSARMVRIASSGTLSSVHFTKTTDVSLVPNATTLTS